MTPRQRLDAARALLEQPAAPPVPGQLGITVPVGEEKPPPVCEHGNPRCGATPTRPYISGPRCDAHQPAITRPYFQRQEPQP